jgi:RNA polymerase sigma factor (sigma-70 family)
VTDSFPDETAEPGHPSVAANNAKSLPELYGRYRAELIAFVRARFGSGPPEPEDVAQQAFANFAALGPHQNVANPRAFLFRIAHNIVINDRKHQSVGRRFLEASPDPREICEAREDFNPEVVLVGKEQYRLIEQVIRNMPEKRRRILLLNRLEGLSYAEIGRRLGLSESVVRKHTALAIRECAAVLLEVQGDEPPGSTGS